MANDFESRRPRFQRREGLMDLSTRSDLGAMRGLPPATSSRGFGPASQMRSGNGALDISTKSEMLVSRAQSRRASDQVATNFKPNQFAAPRRAFSGMNGPNVNNSMRYNLPESSANRSGILKQRSSIPYLDIDLSDTTGRTGKRRGALIKNSAVNDAISPQNQVHRVSLSRSRSHDNLTDTATDAAVDELRRPRRTTVHQNSINKPEPQPALMTQSKVLIPTPIPPMSSLTNLNSSSNQIPQVVHKQDPRYLEKLDSVLSGISEPEMKRKRRFIGRTKVLPLSKSSSRLKEKGDSFYDNYDQREKKKSSWCKEYYKGVIFGLFLFLLGIPVGGYIVSIWPDGETDSEASNISDITKEVDRNTSMSNSLASNNAFIPIPPSDIEARCSASNLPGSLSTCLEACLPASCCYPGFTGETCTDNAGCSLYKPHCDVFYDAWIDGTEGVLRDVSDEIVEICSETEVSNSEESPLQENLSTATDPSIRYNRLRGHHAEGSKGRPNDDSRNLAAPALRDTCQQYCIAARCCDADVIDDPESSGLVLSPFGFFTDAISGEYVMTNCQVSNEENVQLCSKYQQICSSNAETITKPSMTPTTSTSPSATAPPSQSIAPTSTSLPSNQPTVQALDVQTACATDKAKFLITTGDESARAECIQACFDQLCCFTDELGYTLTDSCYDGNEEKCSEYEACLILKDITLQDNSSDAKKLGNKVNLTNKENEANEG